MNRFNHETDFPETNPNLENQKTETRFNHIGISCSSPEEYQNAVNVLTRLGLIKQERPAPDHQRVFFEIPAGTELELQLWPEPGSFRAHFDVISSKPMDTLNQFGQAEDWGEAEVPRGGIKIADHFMVMARPLINK